MKFIIVHNILWSNYKAAVHSKIYELSKEKNVDFHVIQIARSKSNRKNMGAVNLDIHKYPYTLLFDEVLEETSTLDRTKKLWKEIKRQKPDVLFMSYSDVAYYPIILRLKFSKIKLVLGFDSNKYDKKRTFFKELTKKYMLKIPKLVFSYGTMQQEYLAQLGVDKSKMRIRVQGTDTNKLVQIHELHKARKSEWPYPKHTFLYAGRLSPEKNLKFLIEAFKEANLENWGLIIVGEGPQKEQLLNSSMQSENIYVTGGKDWNELIKYYTFSSVFVLPSTSEPWGIVVNEAMWCKKPVLVSSHCGCSKDLVTNANGKLFDPLDKKDLIEQILWFSRNQENLDAMGEQSSKLILKYTDTVSASQILNGIKELEVG